MKPAFRKPVETAPGRMGALSRLPVFLELEGKRAVVSGGSAPAAWKAELLAAAGAHVDVYAVATDPDMDALIERGSPSGTLKRISRPINAADFANAAVAVTDATDDAAAEFYHTARTAGAIVNVIDKPEYCQFQLGSIVNRSPVVIGISTSGGAPILAQAIRRRIETLLPDTLAAWSELALRLRPVVAKRIARGAERRTFWERFADMAFGRPPSSSMHTDLDAAVDRVMAGGTSPAGRVTLVGAGPGNAELLTIKAVRALQAADVILYDDLVSDDVLELARREAKRLLVGKRGRRESCRQDDINALMLKLARQGRNVVRLKSGDPMIFGRAGEEIALLEAEGIPVTVVPGITAGIALASELGISLTHREHAQSVRFVTGHSRYGELPADLDWQGLADPSTTLVFYMSGRTAPLIAQRLIERGLGADTPVVVAAGIGHRESWRWTGDLGELQVRSAFEPNKPILLAIGRALASAVTRQTPQGVVDQFEISMQRAKDAVLFDAR